MPIKQICNSTDCIYSKKFYVPVAEDLSIFKIPTVQMPCGKWEVKAKDGRKVTLKSGRHFAIGGALRLAWIKLKK